MKAKYFTALALLLALVPLGGCSKGRTPDNVANGGELTTPPANITATEETPSVTVTPPEIEEPKIRTTDYLLVTSNSLNIRSAASASASVLGVADKGALLTYTGRTGNWYETRYKNRKAYIHADYAKIYRVPLTEDKDAVEAVIARGFELLGTKYVYGATRYHDGKGIKLSGFTTTEFDCSSYMQYIFLQGAGTLLNVTTRTQVTQGKAVAANDLRRGDLLFFTNASRKNNTGIERVGHVGLYLGDGYVLHTASDYARAEKLTQTRWDYFITARRVI